MENQLLETWDTHCRIMRFLLDAIPEEALKGVPQGMRGRSVGQIFAHIHNNRLNWIEVAAPELMTTIEKIKTRSKADQEAITKALLRHALDASAEAGRTLLAHGLAKGKIKDWGPHIMSFFGYMLAHEWYHHGEICMTLTQAGQPLRDEILYGIWEWKKFGRKED